MDRATVLKIKAHPKYVRLVRRRTRFGWCMTAIMLLLYFGYIGVIAFNKPLLATPVGPGVTSWGIPVGLGLIAATVALTAIYVARANAEFDRLSDELRREIGA